MQPKEQIIQEVENLPEPLLRETLDFILFLKARYSEADVPPEDEKILLTSPQTQQEQTKPKPTKPIRPSKLGAPRRQIVMPSNAPRPDFQDYMD